MAGKSDNTIAKNLKNVPESSPLLANVGLLKSQKSCLICISKRKVLCNTLILSFSYFLYFTGFWSLSNLQSTMNATQGIGVDSQAVIYFCSMISCFFPELFIGKIGAKSTYALSLLLSVPYIAANFSPRWDTMMISSVLLGFASGPMNAALAVYLDEMSVRFTASVEERMANTRAFFFGFYMFFAEFTQVIGNGISYFILVDGRNVPPKNFEIGTECGIRFDSEIAAGVNSNLDPPLEHNRYMVTGIFLILSVLSVAFAFLIHPLKNDIKDVKGCSSVTSKVTSAVRHLKNPQQLLLLPLTIYLGIRSSFYSAEFTQAFIACSWGVHHVGLVSIFFGAGGSLMSVFVGPLVKCVSQVWVIALAAIINAATSLLLYVWSPSPESPVDYFAFAAVWGATDAIWWSQMAALYGQTFPDDREAAFSNYFFWSFLGFFLSYAYANHFTIFTKITIMLVFLVVGITLYIIGQFRARNKCLAVGSGDSRYNLL